MSVLFTPLFYSALRNDGDGTRGSVDAETCMLQVLGVTQRNLSPPQRPRALLPGLVGRPEQASVGG